MKKAYSYFLVFLSLSYVNAQEFSKIVWIDNYKKALSKASEEHKDVLLVVTQPDCRWCGRLMHFTIHSPQVMDYLKKHYILLKLDHNDKKFPKKFTPSVYPTSYILSEHGATLKMMVGYRHADDYMRFIKLKDNNVH